VCLGWGCVPGGWGCMPGDGGAGPCMAYVACVPAYLTAGVSPAPLCWNVFQILVHLCKSPLPPILYHAMFFYFFNNGLSLSLPFLSTFFYPKNQHNFLLSTFFWAWSDEVTMLPVYSMATHILLLSPLLETRICTVFFFSVLGEYIFFLILVKCSHFVAIKSCIGHVLVSFSASVITSAWPKQSKHHRNTVKQSVTVNA
jgi:hypothetical protein